MGPAVVRVRGSARRSAPVGGRGRRAVPVRNPPCVRRGRRAVARGPWGAGVRVSVGQALFVSRGLVVVIVKRSVSLQTVPGRRAAPAPAVRRARGAVSGRGASVMRRAVTGGRPVVVGPLVVRRREVSGRGGAQPPRGGRAVGFPHRGGVGDVGAGHGGRLGQLAAASARGAGPGRGRDGAAAHRTTALSVAPAVGAFARRSGPVALVRRPVVVVVPVFVEGAVVMVVVVAAVFGAAPVSLAVFGGQVSGLRGGAQVCAQAGVDVGVAGQRSLAGPVAAVAVPSSSVMVLLGHLPLQRVILQPDVSARAAVHQAGGGASQRAGVRHRTVVISSGPVSPPLWVVARVLQLVGVGSLWTPVSCFLEHFLGFGRHPGGTLRHPALLRYDVEVVGLQVGAPVGASVGPRALGGVGRLHSLEH